MTCNAVPAAVVVVPTEALSTNVDGSASGIGKIYVVVNAAVVALGVTAVTGISSSK